jgi:hypothetical protein
MEGSLVAYKVFTNGSTLPASEVNENLMQQVVSTFSNAAARTAAITSPVEGQMTYLEDTKQVFIYSGSAWQVISTSATSAYSFVQTLYFTSSGSFTKETYPWLRAIKVKTVGGGGGGAGAGATAAGEINVGGAGGGATTAESFITDIAGLASSVTVTVGAGGSGGVGLANGTQGGESSFGDGEAYEVSAEGGNFGSTISVGSVPRITGNGGPSQQNGIGDIIIPGSSGVPRSMQNSSAGVVLRPGGGFSSMGMGADGGTSVSGSNGSAGFKYGAGGNGGMNTQNQATARTGGAGTDGIVIIELYA